MHIFKRLVFSSFLKIPAVCRVLRSLGGSWASPGTLWGAPGAQQPDQGHGHFEADFGRAAANGAPERETRRTAVPKAFVATGVCSRTLVK